MNTFGKNITLTTFGESHGPAMGGVLDGFPSGFKLDFEKIYEIIRKRKPGSSPLATQRKEDDMPEFLSGINEDGITLGSPIGFIVRNIDHHSSDYDELKHLCRPNHADFTYMEKYGIRDHRGGGRSSARETVNWVIGGAICLQWLNSQGINIQSELTKVGEAGIADPFKNIIKNPETEEKIIISDSQKEAILAEIQKAKSEGDSIGGIVSCLITGVPPGVGMPVADKLQAALAKAMLSINASKGFEYGYGFRSAESKGSETTDQFNKEYANDGKVTVTNNSGGIQGGISNGMSIFFNVAFKPTPTIYQPVLALDYDQKKVKELRVKGRHDPCVALRGVPVVQAMAALVIADFLR